MPAWALRSLARGTVPDQVIDGIARAEAPVPIAVMTYYNLVFRAGHRRMARSLADEKDPVFARVAAFVQQKDDALSPVQR